VGWAAKYLHSWVAGVPSLHYCSQGLWSHFLLGRCDPFTHPSMGPGHEAGWRQRAVEQSLPLACRDH
jgi:hypothetical protein